MKNSTQDSKSYGDWSRAGRQVMRGSKAKWVEGKAVFTYEQTQRKEGAWDYREEDYDYEDYDFNDAFCDIGDR